MNKTALVLAGALAFDLGVVVVSARAAEPLGAAPTGPDATTTASRYIDKTTAAHVFIKLDAVTSRETCVQKSGKVVAVKGVPMCQVPAGAAARWTPLVPRPQEPNR